MNGEVLHCELALPTDFRVHDALEFHRRDREQLAERVSLAGGGEQGGEHGRLEKAFVRDGLAVLLAAELAPGELRAEFVLEGGALPAAAAAALSGEQAERLLRQMFGLDQPVAAFELRHRDHPQLGALIRRNHGLRVVQVSSPFEALSWAIIGQQISLVAAIALRRRFIQAFGPEHGCGLRCYPEAATVARAEVAELRSLGCSQTKAGALLGMARAVVSGELPLRQWQEQLAGAGEAEGQRLVGEIRAALLAMRGIGPWTFNYTLLRGFGWLDGGLEGDVAVRRGLQRLLGLEKAPGERETREWLVPFQPWRALVAAHLWTISGPQNGPLIP